MARSLSIAGGKSRKTETERMNEAHVEKTMAQIKSLRHWALSK